MSCKGTRILELSQYQKFHKVPFIIYADFECFIKNIDRYTNDPDKLSRIKVGETYSIRFFNVCNIII